MQPNVVQAYTVPFQSELSYQDIIMNCLHTNLANHYLVWIKGGDDFKEGVMFLSRSG